jgi:hypothetical protein
MDVRVGMKMALKIDLKMALERDGSADALVKKLKGHPNNL